MANETIEYSYLIKIGDAYVKEMNASSTLFTKYKDKALRINDDRIMYLGIEIDSLLGLGLGDIKLIQTKKTTVKEDVEYKYQDIIGWGFDERHGLVSQEQIEQLNK